VQVRATFDHSAELLMHLGAARGGRGVLGGGEQELQEPRDLRLDLAATLRSGDGGRPGHPEPPALGVAGREPDPEDAAPAHDEPREEGGLQEQGAQDALAPLSARLLASPLHERLEGEGVPCGRLRADPVQDAERRGELLVAAGLVAEHHARDLAPGVHRVAERDGLREHVHPRPGPHRGRLDLDEGAHGLGEHHGRLAVTEERWVEPCVDHHEVDLAVGGEELPLRTEHRDGAGQRLEPAGQHLPQHLHEGTLASAPRERAVRGEGAEQRRLGADALNEHVTESGPLHQPPPRVACTSRATPASRKRTGATGRSTAGIVFRSALTV
jgi:hypothetical protein